MFTDRRSIENSRGGGTENTLLFPSIQLPLFEEQLRPAFPVYQTRLDAQSIFHQTPSLCVCVCVCVCIFHSHFPRVRARNYERAERYEKHDGENERVKIAITRASSRGCFVSRAFAKGKLQKEKERREPASQVWFNYAVARWRVQRAFTARLDRTSKLKYTQPGFRLIRTSRPARNVAVRAYASVKSAPDLERKSAPAESWQVKVNEVEWMRLSTPADEFEMKVQLVQSSSANARWFVRRLRRVYARHSLLAGFERRSVAATFFPSTFHREEQKGGKGWRSSLRINFLVGMNGGLIFRGSRKLISIDSSSFFLLPL